jgi:hypothetical protein
MSAVFIVRFDGEEDNLLQLVTETEDPDALMPRLEKMAKRKGLTVRMDEWQVCDDREVISQAREFLSEI